MQICSFWPKLFHIVLFKYCRWKHPWIGYVLKIKKAKSRRPSHKKDDQDEDDATEHNLNPNGCVRRGKRVARTRWRHIWRGLPCPGVLDSCLLLALLFSCPGPRRRCKVHVCPLTQLTEHGCRFINAFGVLSIFYRAFCPMSWVGSLPSGSTISIVSGRSLAPSFSPLFFYPFRSASVLRNNF